MYLRQLRLGSELNFSYLLGPEQGLDTAVVDPGFEVEKVLSQVKADGRRIVLALLTHTHGDHTAGLARIVRETDSPVYVHPLEKERAQAALGGVEQPALHPVKDGDEIPLGELVIKAIHTPGHTPGGLCYRVNDKLFTGDTLFVNGSGRCDLSGGDPRALYDSLYKKLMVLPDDTQVLSGHDYGDIPISSLAREKQRNPYLRWESVEGFVQYRMVDYLKEKQKS
jgi:glyoxylase-like metal-dependent hydrolase (beta-lactamase superfamily II)